MSWANPSTPNIVDLESYVMGQTGATTSQLPSEPSDMLGRILINASGSGITSITITATPSPTGDVALISGVISNGSLLAAQITYPGSGYTSPPTLLITVNAGATAPSLTPFLAPIYLQYALEYATSRVLGEELTFIPITEYIRAVYQLALHWLICWAPDPTGSTIFESAREKYNVFGFKGGVIVSGGDSGTSASVAVPEGLKDLPLENLLQLKTPWGIAYLSYAQKYGPYVFGIS